MYRGRGRSTTHGGRGSGRSDESSRSTLLAAVALQDHIARTMRIPGGPSKLPSMQPGADLTLAQHLGLVPRPPPLLTEGEWNQVHLASRLRQDSAHECPICREDFKLDPQVLLSCTHTFHRACLASYERYARAKCCPLCRSQQYQKKIIQDGAEAHRQKCATTIQAAVRGHLARKRYKELRKSHPPSDPRLKRNWAAERLQEQSDKLLDDIDAERGDLDALFAELDASLAISRAVCDEVARPAARRFAQAQQEAEAAAATAAAAGTLSTPRDVLGSDHDRTSNSAATTSGAGQASSLQQQQGLMQSLAAHSSESVDWKGVICKAEARGDGECPICIGPLKRRGKAGVAVLSCSHCFHLECITAFEGFELAQGARPTCPLCRSHYQRRCMQ